MLLRKWSLKEHHEKLSTKVNNCTKEMLEAKNNYIIKMNDKCIVLNAISNNHCTNSKPFSKQ